MTRVLVLDTCAVISYFSKVFNERTTISEKSLELITKAFGYSELRIIVPTMVFVELYQLYFKNEEKARQIVYEVFNVVKDAPNFEIRGFDKEALLKFITINDIEPDYRFDNHDKQILATAMVMNCPLMTSDTKIKRYNDRRRVIPEILN